MPLRNFYYYYLLFFLISSNISYAQKNNVFDNLSKDESEKLADKYHKLSQNFSQTSEMHRMYKDSALMAAPYHVEHIQRTSYSYKKAGEHIKAMQLLNKAVAIDTANGKTSALEYKAWSMLYFYRDYEQTIQDVDAVFAISKIPYNACHGEPCLLLKAQAYYQLKDYVNCIETINEMFKVEKNIGYDSLDNFLASFYISRAYMQLKEYAKAIPYFEEQLAVYDNFTEMHFYYGKLLMETKDYKKAEKHLLKAKELMTKNIKFKEPYVERFDEVFPHEIETTLKKLYDKTQNG